MDVYLAAFGAYRGVGAMRPMSRQDEDVYYRNTEWAWSKVAAIAAAALPFSALNPGKTTHEGNYAVGALPTAEAGQWH
ncbi:hypothetical protein [Devosia nitrariae]|uniref:Uncharacterized protein n=1 Tax=Devosia nitrariae TaxID=2071872 RepID=A0ABQ5WAU1_9HYPH|nr:hypothetical protein [Devosia nitrariae]GLQ56947.1 hypothetical protein GCM10010862_42060 [Devosia nitrariae]